MPQLKATARSLLLVAACASLLGACRQRPRADPESATRATFARATVAYLAAHGELCLGKQFPIDVSEREFQLRARNAVQMPALEHLGLVTSSAAMGQTTTEDGPVAVPVTRFELTETGRPYYRAPSGVAEGPKPLGDLCVAKLSLDQVVSWEMSASKATQSALVKYTYQVNAAPWTRVPEIKAVFPAVARVIAGAGSALLEQSFTLTHDGWVASDWLPPDAQPLARNGAR
jgi:hypothetical protein